jgi:hypothetical protein
LAFGVWGSGRSMNGGEPLWHLLQRPRDFRPDALHECKPSQQAAPGNDPNAWVVSWLCLKWMIEPTAGRDIALGNSREPPVQPDVLAFLALEGICEVLGHVLKRLQSCSFAARLPTRPFAYPDKPTGGYPYTPRRPFSALGLGKRNRFSLESSKGGSLRGNILPRLAPRASKE